MKRRFFQTFLVALILLLFSTNTLLSQQLLEGENYNIIVPNISPGGDFLIDGDGDYRILSTMGDPFIDPRLYSDSYSLTASDVFFEPEIPGIACFETNTDGSSDCSTAPSFISENGMIRACGPGGCYNRARFEIDPKGNPSDTLYGIDISKDNFAEDLMYIDGNTFMPKETRDINDYKTKTDWETSVLNIKGLQANTEYSLRIVALYGDFTESAPSQIQTATTVLATMSFQIGLDYENGESINYNPPYEILFDGSFEITRGANVVSSDRLIWTLTNTNSASGIAIVQKGEHGGLHNTVEPYTINSLTGDLNSVSEGIGLKNYQTSQLYYDTDGSLAVITPEVNYNSEEANSVGIIDSVFKTTYYSNGPIHTGQTALRIKTKASLTTPEGSYSEDLTFVLIAKY